MSMQECIVKYIILKELYELYNKLTLVDPVFKISRFIHGSHKFRSSCMTISCKEYHLT